MSKLFKRITAILLAVALIAPVVAVANPQIFGPNPEYGPDYGSLTVIVTRTDEDVVPPVTIPRSGVPVQIHQVTFANGLVPETGDLQDEAWVTEYATFIGEPIVSITDADGAATFEQLPLGIWFIQELATYEDVDGTVINNPYNPNEFFYNSAVGIPSWIPELENGVEVGGEWQYDMTVYTKQRRYIPDTDEPDIDEPGEVNEKSLVGTIGNIATWEIRYSIPHDVDGFNHFMVRDTHSTGLRFISGSVVGRFTPAETANNGWEAGRELRVGVDFTVTYNVETRRTDIAFTSAGINRLATEGSLGQGTVMFRLQSEILNAGISRNIAQWYYDADEPYCPIDDPDCEDPYDFCLIYPDDPRCQDIPGDSIRTFYLELLKRSTAEGNPRLTGAVFHMYRELTAYEAVNLSDAAFTALGGRTATGNVRVIPLLDAEDRPVRGTTNADGITNFGRMPLTSEGAPHTTAENPRLWLFEYEAPTGYSAITPWVPVHVTRDYSRPEPENVLSRYVDIVVYNDPIPLTRLPAPNLPQTGTIAIGTVLIGGVALISGLTLAKKRKKD